MGFLDKGESHLIINSLKVLEIYHDVIVKIKFTFILKKFCLYPKL